jgi:hypothetical protein
MRETAIAFSLMMTNVVSAAMIPPAAVTASHMARVAMISAPTRSERTQTISAF